MSPAKTEDLTVHVEQLRKVAVIFTQTVAQRAVDSYRIPSSTAPTCCIARHGTHLNWSSRRSLVSDRNDSSHGLTAVLAVGFLLGNLPGRKK